MKRGFCLALVFLFAGCITIAQDRVGLDFSGTVGLLDEAVNSSKGVGVEARGFGSSSTNPTSCSDPYCSAVRADNPFSYWRLGEIAGTTAADEMRRYPGTYYGSPPLGATALIGGRLACDTAGPYSPPNGTFIFSAGPGPIVFLNCEFETDQINSSHPFTVPNWNILVAGGNPITGGSGKVLAIGCMFPLGVTNPFRADPGGINQRWYLLGCHSSQLTPTVGTVSPLDDFIVNVNSAGRERLALGNLRSLSTTNTLSNNVRGTVTISGTAISAPVTFPTPEPDTNYSICLTVAGGDGVIGVPYPSNLAPSGFTANVSAAPGAGHSITLNWLLVR